MQLLPLFLLLPLLTSALQNTPVPSARLPALPVPLRPFGTRLFLTNHPNWLNLVWTCRLPAATSKQEFVKNTTVEFYYDSSANSSTVRTASTANVTQRYKESAGQKLFGQFNTTVELLCGKRLLYRVSCDGRLSRQFEVKYKYWDDEQDDSWALLSVGSLGLYNTTQLALGTIKLISDNLKNVLWAIPGGLVADHTKQDNDNSSISELESWSRWISWIQLVENVTCCVPLAAAPSLLDLYPYTPGSTHQSNFRHFMELPFASDHEVLWYSFNHRNLHVISICTYCDLADNSSQYKWLEDDLKEADANNDTHWIMVMGHEPIYNTEESLHPEVLTKARVQLDRLFDKYNVDFAVWSHERWYERSKPLRNFQVTDTRVSNSLHHVNGTIHYTCGTGGVPLQTYNMDKYNRTARFYASQYGACSFHRIQKDVYDTMFVYENNSVITIHDFVQISKIITVPAPPSPDLDNHFSRFMKLFGIIIVGGAVVMLLLILLIKLVQQHDPAFITNKIRNIKYRKSTTTTINMSCEQLNVDASDLHEDNRDTVMLLEEEEERVIPHVSSAALYGITM